MKKKKINISRFSKSNWVITLISTMLGVLAALYLNDYNEDKKLEKQNEKALTYVSKEITENAKTLKHFDSILNQKFKKLYYLSSYFNDDMAIIVPTNEWDEFKNQTIGLINDVYTEKLQNSDEELRVRGQMDLIFNSELSMVDLKDLVWESYKQSNYQSTTDFQCITNIEGLYSFQRKHSKYLNRWRDRLMEANFFSNKQLLHEFMELSNRLIKYNQFLLKSYEEKDDIMKPCTN